jgi:hypothetical protein
MRLKKNNARVAARALAKALVATAKQSEVRTRNALPDK